VGRSELGARASGAIERDGGGGVSPKLVTRSVARSGHGKALLARQDLLHSLVVGEALDAELRLLRFREDLCRTVLESYKSCAATDCRCRAVQRMA
jgi:hypothetical protein